jgi:2-polyprenyl-6-methoxyphenol hydroxylase-like FAD-dependent oxidoreductase
MPQYKILVAGAGIGGLAAASCLMNAGHDVEIYEQAPQLSEVGAGIQISANAMHVLRYLGLEDAITRAGVRPGAYVFRLYDSGEIIQQFSLSDEHERLHGAPYTQLHRADFHEILAAKTRQFKPDVVRLDRRVVGFSETSERVELQFVDGCSAYGDMLIGADGLKSVVSGQIVGEVQATYTGDAAWRVTVPVERLPLNFLDKVMSVFMGPGGHAVCYYVRGGALLNFVGVVETDESSEESWTVKMPWAKGELQRLASDHPDDH